MRTTKCAVIGTIPNLEDAAGRFADNSGPLLVLVPATATTKADVTAVLCDRDARWKLVTQLAHACHPVVAVLQHLTLPSYGRALALGAAVVHRGAPATVFLDVIQGAQRSEVLIPTTVAQFIAAGPSTEPRAYLASRECDVLRMLADGSTLVQVAAALHYSERTVRRWVRGLHLRFGTQTRAGLLEAVQPHLRDRT